MIRSFADVFSKIKDLPRRRVAVAAAEDQPVLEAVAFCRDNGIADALLFGSEAEIRAIAQDSRINLDGFEIIDEPDKAKAALLAADRKSVV